MKTKRLIIVCVRSLFYNVTKNVQSQILKSQGCLSTDTVKMFIDKTYLQKKSQIHLLSTLHEGVKTLVSLFIHSFLKRTILESCLIIHASTDVLIT